MFVLRNSVSGCYWCLSLKDLMATRAHGGTKKIYMNQKWANISCASTSKSGSKGSKMCRMVNTTFFIIWPFGPYEPLLTISDKNWFFGQRKKNALYDQRALEENNWFLSKINQMAWNWSTNEPLWLLSECAVGGTWPFFQYEWKRLKTSKRYFHWWQTCSLRQPIDW